MPWLQGRSSMNMLSSLALSGFSFAVLGISKWDSMLLDASFCGPVASAGLLLVRVFPMLVAQEHAA